MYCKQVHITMTSNREDVTRMHVSCCIHFEINAKVHLLNVMELQISKQHGNNEVENNIFIVAYTPSLPH